MRIQQRKRIGDANRGNGSVREKLLIVRHQIVCLGALNCSDYKIVPEIAMHASELRGNPRTGQVCPDRVRMLNHIVNAGPCDSVYGKGIRLRQFALIPGLTLQNRPYETVRILKRGKRAQNHRSLSSSNIKCRERGRVSAPTTEKDVKPHIRVENKLEWPGIHARPLSRKRSWSASASNSLEDTSPYSPQGACCPSNARISSTSVCKLLTLSRSTDNPASMCASAGSPSRKRSASGSFLWMERYSQSQRTA